MIPRVIYQTWKSKKLSPAFSSYRSLMLRTVDCESILFDDNDIETWISCNCSPDILAAYKLIQTGAGRADFWRYLIIYANGGFYLDIDSSISVDFFRHITPQDEGIVSREANSGFFLQWLFGFNAGHPVLKRCIELCLDSITKCKSQNPFWVTGPAVFTLAINQVYSGVIDKHANLYYLSDEELGSLLSNPSISSTSEHKRLRVISVDFDGAASFKHRYAGDLYSSSSDHWTNQIGIASQSRSLKHSEFPVIF